MVLIMHVEEINDLKNYLIDYIVPLLDDLRSDIKGVDSICRTFVSMKNDTYDYTTDPIELADTIKLALDEICNSNSDVCGRVDVFDLEDTIDKTYEVPAEAKVVVWILFLEKDKDKYDHPDINRLYAQHPEFFTGYFDDIPIYDPSKIDKFDFKSYLGYLKSYFDTDYNGEHFALNQHTRYLFEEFVRVKEGNTPFMHLTRRESKVLDDPLIKEIVLDTRFITDAVIDRAKQEGLKCKTVKLMFDDTDYDEHIFIYKSESEKMNKAIQSLEKVEPNRIGKVIYSHCDPTCWITLRCNQRK